MFPRRFFLRLPPVLLILAGAVSAQLGSVWVSLDDRVGPPDWAFGLNVAPDGQVYHVAVSGGLGSSNNRHLAVVDRVTRSVLARHPVGLYPLEVAYEVIPATPTQPPRARKIFVTNSTDGTVSVLDRSGKALKTIPLGSSSYPFGIAMDPTGARLAVTTKSERIFLIDVATLSVSQTLKVPGYHGRVVFLADGRMVFGSAVPSGGKTEVTATFMNPAQPAGARILQLMPPSTGWPSVEDVAIVNNGKEAWFPILGGDRTLRRVDTRTCTQVGSVSLAGLFPSGLLHGIASSGEGHVLATSLGSGEDVLALLRTSPPSLVSSIRLGFGQQANDAVFTPDAREACVTMQYGQAGVHILTGLPVPAFRLITDNATPSPGGRFCLKLRGAEGFSRSVVGLSITGSGPIQILGYTFNLSPPIVPIWLGPHDIRGRASLPAIQVPDVPTLKGLTLHLQAFVEERGLKFRVSNPLGVTVQ